MILENENFDAVFNFQCIDIKLFSMG